MYLTEQLQWETERHHVDDVDHVSLYRTVLKERHGVVIEKSGRLFFEKRAEAIVPKGNLYRYCGLAAERLTNSADLWEQLDVLADVYKHVLKGSTRDERTKELVKALEETHVRGSPEMEKGEVSVGYMPLEEFFSEGRSNSYLCGLLVLPEDNAAKRRWFSFRFITVLVCAIQWIAPLVIFLYQWRQPHNPFLNNRKIMKDLTLQQLFCLGPNYTEQLQPLIGVMLLELIILIIHAYIRDCRANALKSSRLPINRCWYFLGNLTNMWCCVLTVIGLPVLFWSEASPTSTAMDSLTTLFIFMLDDFAGYACQYADVTDVDFQRAAMWQLAVLSQCPLNLKDMVVPGATSAGDIWQIGFDSGGRLKKAISPDRCTRRIEANRATDKRPLIDNSYSYFYRTSAKDSGAVLPRREAYLLDLMWRVLDRIFMVLQIVLPLLWIVVDKPCHVQELPIIDVLE